jgi:hypothetical protein
MSWFVSFIDLLVWYTRSVSTREDTLFERTCKRAAGERVTSPHLFPFRVRGNRLRENAYRVSFLSFFLFTFTLHFILKRVDV